MSTATTAAVAVPTSTAQARAMFAEEKMQTLARAWRAFLFVVCEPGRIRSKLGVLLRLCCLSVLSVCVNAFGIQGG